MMGWVAGYCDASWRKALALLALSHRVVEERTALDTGEAVHSRDADAVVSRRKLLFRG